MSIEKRSVLVTLFVYSFGMKKDPEDRSLTIASPLRSVIKVVGGWSSSDRTRDVLVNRAHAVMDRFERVSDTMQKVADIQLDVMERLRPIVDDLGELVKLSLVEARQRVGSSVQAPEPVIEHRPVSAESKGSTSPADSLRES